MKRAQRMVLVQSYQEKLAAKLERAEADGQERYAKRLLALRNKLAKIGQEIERADAQLTVLQKTHNDLTATERAIKDL
jgi:chromosome segregation ATPase